jgi:hypothetical protein
VNYPVIELKRLFKGNCKLKNVMQEQVTGAAKIMKAFETVLLQVEICSRKEKG